MADVFQKVPDLIEQGKAFTYENFSSKSGGGYPNAYSGTWLVWTHRVNEVVQKLGPSPISNSIARGLATECLGETEHHFLSAKNLIVSGLEAAQEIHRSEIPASDRTVTLGHNTPEQIEALGKIDELITAVTEANDFPGSDEDKGQAIAELSAARKLFEAARVRVASVRATVEPSIKWLIEKSAGSIVGRLANSLWDFLVGLHFF